MSSRAASGPPTMASAKPADDAITTVSAPGCRPDTAIAVAMRSLPASDWTSAVDVAGTSAGGAAGGGDGGGGETAPSCVAAVKAANAGLAEKSCRSSPKFCSTSPGSVPVSRAAYQNSGPAHAHCPIAWMASVAISACLASLTAGPPVPVGAPNSVAHTCLAPSPLAAMRSWTRGMRRKLFQPSVPGCNGTAGYEYGCTATASNVPRPPAWYTPRRNVTADSSSLPSTAGARPPRITVADGSTECIAADAAASSRV